MAKKVVNSERISERAWYAVHTLTGYEKRVKENLEDKIATQGLEDVIFNVIVPIREESEYKDGKRRIVKRKIFPGYVLVEMIVDNDSWYVVRNTQGVTGFVGTERNPVPLSQDEVDRIFNEMLEGKADDSIGFQINDNVRIIDGIFENRVGIIKKIDSEQQRIKVLVEDMPVDLDVSQVEKIY